MSSSVVAAVVSTFAMAIASSAARADQAAACKLLEKTDFAGIQDAPTQVMHADIVSTAANAPAHCHVQGYIAPQVGFELKLPVSSWSGKFVEIGCGGLCGTTRSKDTVAWCNDAVRRGHACIVTDRGHASSAAAGGRAAGDGLWASGNLQAKLDYGFRASHVAALAGKAITKHYYRVSPKRSYFMGCSGGGRQALMQAQRFPWDFDGIISMDAGPRLWSIHATLLWNARAMMGEDGKPLFVPAHFELLHAAALAKCDLDDGVKDGVISDPPACKFDPGELLCKDDAKSACLSAVQVAAARKVYSGPTTSSGERLYFGSMPGSELGSMFSGAAYSTEFFRYLAFMPEAGPRWHAQDFDFDVDYKRAGVMASLYEPGNPDLRRFQAAGGKLMIVQGWHDSGSPMPLDTADYYEMVEKILGGRARTQESVRLFMMPGRAHCGGGPGANAFDYLTYLDAWVDRGQAPDVLIGAHVDSEDPADFVRQPTDPGRVGFTRPVHPYPVRARYTGHGDPDDHRNFEPVSP